MPRSSVEICVVIVAFRNTDDLRECLESLRWDGPGVLVDNEGDPAVVALAQVHGFEYVTRGVNIGFAAAVNLGLTSDAARERDVLLLNPDARVDRRTVERLQEVLRSPGSPTLAAVSPRLLGGSEQRVMWPVPSPGLVWREALRLPTPASGPRFVVGAVLLLRKEALADVGLLDERFFVYAEECDWQHRAQQKGWGVAEVGELTARHAQAGSSGNGQVRELLFYRSGELFFRKWYGRRGWQAARAGIVLGALIRLVIRRSGHDWRRLVLHLVGPSRSAAKAGL